MNVFREVGRVELDGGKYTAIRFDLGGGVTWLRHGKPWPAMDELRHSNAVNELVDEVLRLRRPAEPEIEGIDGTTRKAHYGAGRQPWDDIKDFGWGPAFAAGNALKYVRRAAAKNGEDDLKKARWYYDELNKLATAKISSASPRSAMESLKDRERAVAALNRLDATLTAEERATLHEGLTVR